MSVQTNGDAGQAPTTGTPGQGQDPTGAAGQQGTEPAGQAPADGSPQFDPASIQDPALRAYLERQTAELDRARQEAAAHRVKAREAAEAADAARRAQETDAERIAREAAEAVQERDTLRNQVRELTVTTALTAAAQAAKAHNPARVAALLDAQVELDDKGNPTNVGKILADLQKSDAYLFERQPTGADAGASGRGKGSSAPGVGVNDLIRNGRRAQAR